MWFWILDLNYEPEMGLYAIFFPSVFSKVYQTPVLVKISRSFNSTLVPDCR